MEQLITFLLAIGAVLGISTMVFMLLSPPKKKKYTAPPPTWRPSQATESRKAPETLVKPQPGVPMQSKATNAPYAKPVPPRRNPLPESVVPPRDRSTYSRDELNDQSAANAAMAAAYIHTEIMERTTPSYEAPVDNYRCGGGDSPSSDNSGSDCSSGGGGDD